jgi:two-component system chemotaxis response regulator CheB
MANPQVVVVGGSAGAIEALLDIVGTPPEQFAAPMLVVVHVPATARSNLPRILERSGPLPADHAVDGDRLASGRIIVAPPDRHLTIEDGRVRLDNGPRENDHRPAIDPLLRSAARWWRWGRSMDAPHARGPAPCRAG